ncbi:RICIN domain-containing protein [Streptomyces vietnamensis]|uniref:Ricin B lectin domain-containing protein n=1 Tax=Streptomyces vietnamensis TaxID=362257 RepID=A0A0B5HTE4_9ACTN|nr:ricin-type beta-trefoil lectin domain protein [Streptomyces vietnamensis]AJF63721.1 hypothetical protein SVTN_03890 [Streptomyces vietnamensis]
MSEAGHRGSWTSVAETSATGGVTPLSPTVTLVNAASGTCVDLPDGATIAGTEPTLYTCRGGTDQRWTFTAAGALTGKDGVRLDGSGTTVTARPCNDSAGQKWQLDAQSSGPHGGRRLALVGAGTANGTKLALATCAASAAALAPHALIPPPPPPGPPSAEFHCRRPSDAKT